MRKTALNKYERAQKKVKDIKGFYNHLIWFIIINIILLVVRFKIYDFFKFDFELKGEDFAYWLDLNLIISPALWLVGLTIHGLYVFKHKFRFFDDWEKRQIEKYMEEDSDSKYL